MHDDAAGRNDLCRNLLIAEARRQGFSNVGFARVGPTPRLDAFDEWLARGMHGDMGYLATRRDERADPRTRLPSARTAMVLQLAHHHRRPPDPGGRTGMVARYAWGRDYHNLAGKRLRRLRKVLREEHHLDSWGGIDTAPILERAWAAEAGLGFNGKNCMQIFPARGSWFFVAVLFLPVELEPDPPLGDHCGTCRRCLDACPTDAFPSARVLDARRCIAYWTIEAPGLPPRELRAGFGRWVFGCDVCQEVCPHNTQAPDATEDDFLPSNAWLDLDTIVQSEDEALMDRFIGTPLRRPKAAGLKRNALIGLGNLGDDGGVDSARRALEHPSPVVRGAAVWALDRLGDARVHGLRDPDPIVQAELDALRG